MGGVLARLAAREARKKGTKVIYTAHGFHFCKGAPLENWMLYYPIEKRLAHYTDCLITINEEDYQLSKKTFQCLNRTCSWSRSEYRNLPAHLRRMKKLKKKVIWIPTR